MQVVIPNSVSVFQTAGISQEVVGAFYGDLKESLVKPLLWNDWETKEIGEEKIWSMLPCYGYLEVFFGYLNGDNRHPVGVRLGKDGIHMTIIGESGSGKSVLANFMICSSALYISPKYLRYTLVDMKAAELPQYANGKYKLPHARVVAGTTDVGYVISILKDFVERMEARNQLVTSIGSNNVKDYYERTGILLPTEVLFIDEFGALILYASKQEQREFEEYMNLVSKLGRNTHFFLQFATQNMPMDIDPGILANFNVKTCLKVSSEKLALQALGNPAPIYLPPQGYCYVNYGSGLEDKNRKYRIPFFDSNFRDDVLELLHKRAVNEGIFEEPLYYSEKQLQEWPDTWEDDVVADKSKLLFGVSGQYTPGRWYNYIGLPNTVGSNIIVLSNDPVLRDNLLSTLVSVIDARGDSKYLIGTNFSDIKPIAHLFEETYMKEIVSDANESEIIAQVSSIIKSRKLIKSVIGQALLRGETSLTPNQFREACEMSRNVQDYPTPFFTVNSTDNTREFSEDLKMLVEDFYPHVEALIENECTYSTQFIFIDNIEGMKGLGVKSSNKLWDFISEAPQYNVRFVLTGYNINEIKSQLRTSTKIVIGAQLTDKVGDIFGLEFASRIPPSIAVGYNSLTQEKSLFKLKPSAEIISKLKIMSEASDASE